MSTDDDLAQELLDVFAAEAAEHLLTVGRALPELRAEPGAAGPLCDLRRAFHTLKGASASVGVAAVATLAHRAEDLLDALADSGRPAETELVDLLFGCHDALEDLTAGRSDDAALAGLYGRLDAALAGARPEPATDAEPLPEEPAPAPEERQAGRFLRVPVERLDDAVKLVGESVISRSGFERSLGQFRRLAAELRQSCDRLRRVAGRLEAGTEARALEGGRPAAPRRGGHGFDELEFDRYTDFHLLSREMAETASDLGTLTQELAALGGDFDGYVVRQSRLTGELQDKLMRVRMVPLASLAARLDRIARQASAASGKPARLALEGEATELDKNVLEEVSEPLLHLIRNAVDHGIEPAEVRAAAGKPAEGAVRVRATGEGTQVVIRVGDDGGGIDPERVRAAAVARGLLAPDEAERLAPAALFELLFRPGFSTADEVTELSGRGVGLDAVRGAVARLKGTVGVESEVGRGTTFTVRLPLTLAVIRGLLVRAAGQTFAVPLAAVRQILRPAPEASADLDGALLRVGGRTLPRVRLAAALGLREPGGNGAGTPVLVLSAGEREYAVAVDEILGSRELVVKGLGGHVRRAPGVAGATFLGDGSVVLILDPAGLFAPAQRPDAPQPAAPRPAPGGLTALLVDDSPSVRRVVAGQLRDAGWSALTARDGLDALELLHRTEPPPDVVVLDVEMPRMDGYELLATLRAAPATRDLPVVMLTSRAGAKHRAKAAELGATGYLVKPYQPAELVRTLGEAASNRTGSSSFACQD